MFGVADNDSLHCLSVLVVCTGYALQELKSVKKCWPKTLVHFRSETDLQKKLVPQGLGFICVCLKWRRCRDMCEPVC